MADDGKCPNCGAPKVEGRMNCDKCGAGYPDLEDRELEKDPEKQGD